MEADQIRLDQGGLLMTAEELRQDGQDKKVQTIRLSESVTLICGDALHALPEIKNVDAVLTDPPYSSGGLFRGDRNLAPSVKYVQTGAENTCRQEFTGDNRDQRAFLSWATMWLLDCHAACKPGAVVMVFSDWRQLPTITDALQCAGWVWRNLVTWWKPGIRMQRGRFSGSAEYVIYGSIGVQHEGERSPQNVISCAPVAGEDKQHIAQKPIPLLAELMGVISAGGLVLDPFMGSGSTAIAAIRTGRRFIGIEKDPVHFKIALERISQELAQQQLPFRQDGQDGQDEARMTGDRLAKEHPVNPVHPVKTSSSAGARKMPAIELEGINPLPCGQTGQGKAAQGPCMAVPFAIPPAFGGPR